MSVDKQQEEFSLSIRCDIDIDWKSLIADSENQITTCKDKIDRLRKSIKFFKKQEADGVPFPVNVKRHANTS